MTTDDFKKALLAIRNQLNKTYGGKLCRLSFFEIFSALNFRHNSCGMPGHIKVGVAAQVLNLWVSEVALLSSLCPIACQTWRLMIWAKHYSHYTTPYQIRNCWKTRIFFLKYFWHLFFRRNYYGMPVPIMWELRLNSCLCAYQKMLSCHHLVQLPARNDSWWFRHKNWSQQGNYLSKGLVEKWRRFFGNIFDTRSLTQSLCYARPSYVEVAPEFLYLWLSKGAAADMTTDSLNKALAVIRNQLIKKYGGNKLRRFFKNLNIFDTQFLTQFLWYVRTYNVGVAA